MVIGEHVVVGSMRYGVRWTEELLIKALFRFHPRAGERRDALRRLRGAAEQLHARGRRRPLSSGPTCWCSASASGPRRRRWTSSATSCSQQSGGDRRDRGGDAQGAHRHPPGHDLHPGGPRAVRRVSPRSSSGPERLPVLHRRKGQDVGAGDARTFSRRSAAVGLPLEPVFAGGQHRTSQEREQWASACNFLAVRPGTIVSYRRNEATLVRAPDGGVPGGARQQLSGLRRLARRQASHRDHHRGHRAGPGRRRPSLHDASAPAGRHCDRDSRPIPRALSPTGCSRFLRQGPRSPRPSSATAVLGLPRRAGRWSCERIAIALLGADPRVRQLDDGRWAAGGRGAGLAAARRTARSRWWTSRPPACGPPAATGSPRSPWWWCTAAGARWCSSRWSIPAARFPGDRASSPASPTPWCAHAPTFAAGGRSGARRAAGRVFVAHNARFDWGFVSAEVQRARDLALDGPRLCTVRLARRLVTELRSCGLDSLTHALRLRERRPPPRRRRRPGHRRAARSACCSWPARRAPERWQDLTAIEARRAARARRSVWPSRPSRRAGLRARGAAGAYFRVVHGRRTSLPHARGRTAAARRRRHVRRGAASRCGTREIAPDERNRIPLAMRCLLVEHPDGLVLIDTGLGNKEDAQVSRHLRRRERGLRGRHAARGRAARPRDIQPRRHPLGDQHPPAFRPRGREHDPVDPRSRTAHRIRRCA